MQLRIKQPDNQKTGKKKGKKPHTNRSARKIIAYYKRSALLAAELQSTP